MNINKPIAGLVLLHLVGCATIANTVVGREAGFRSFLDKKIGNSIDEEMVGSYGVTIEPLSIKQLDYEYTEYTFEYSVSPHCKWAAIVKRAEGVIVRWEYRSPKENCLRDRFYAGPW